MNQRSFLLKEEKYSLKQILFQVSPKSGEALRTSFSFKTETPENFSVPLLYKYGILTKSNMKIFLVEQYDTTTIETILPFSGNSYYYIDN